MRWAAILLVAGCRMGMGASQTAMVGHAARAGDDVSFERRTGEITVHAWFGRVLTSLHGGFGGFSMRVRSGATATEVDDVGLMTPTGGTAGYAVPVAPFLVIPFVGYNLLLDSLIG